MTDSNEGPVSGASASPSAGQLLRAAREAQGMHVAALAAVLKVPAAKLEALEADRYDELQGATFLRALAKAACRALKIDPAPVLARLPRAEVDPLGTIGQGINARFRADQPQRELVDNGGSKRGLLIAVVVLVLAAAALWLLPSGVFQWGSLTTTVETALPASSVASAVESVASAASSVVGQSAAAMETVASSAATASAPALSASEAHEAAVAGAPLGASGVVAPAASAPPVAPTGHGMVQLRAAAPSWVELIDATGQSLVGRILHQGEMINIEGVLPMRLKVGNVAGTEVVFQGRPVDLKPLARDNVARLELK
ncbi:helix-turn-helix domain-containing protein [Ideonella sp. B7]|uniref:helix-turn-helix domain-containing protein n=1 Tax=Ideonella benzenivorans TaxID=2831643 RepID=UPI001CEE078F|nr:helix-turn-helix domain-containing protein [Ideonella benzenivorans]MCA6217576.1 helix-turn-helix domain-containing protein [Ideonella benzenivorans]